MATILKALVVACKRGVHGVVERLVWEGLKAVATTFSLAIAAYDSINFSVLAQSTNSKDLFFSADGTKLYILNNSTGTTDSIFQYTLSTPWDLSTATYDSVSFTVGTQEAAPEGMFFKPDGTKLYVVGFVNDTVYQYTLSTPWDLSTASYDTVSISVNSQAGVPSGLSFKSDGTKMYIAGFSTNAVYQYTLSTPWDISTATYDTVSFSTGSQTTGISGIVFNSTGTKFFACCGSTDVIYSYTLSTPWDLSTASYDDISFSILSQENDVAGVFVKSDGTKMYIVGSGNDSIFQYTVGSSEVNNTGEDHVAMIKTATINVTGTFGTDGNIQIRAGINGGTESILDITEAGMYAVDGPLDHIQPFVSAGDGTTDLDVTMLVELY